MSGEDHIRLVNEISRQRLAGIIFASSICMIDNTPLVLEVNIPRIYIGTRIGNIDIPSISLDSKSFIDRSLDYLVSRNCRRIAFISTPGYKDTLADKINVFLARRKLPFIPELHQMCPLNYAEAASNLVRLLMWLPREKRPEAIIVADDNLTEPVCNTLRLLNVNVPEDLEIVSHCNFPRTSSTSMPVKFIGYDIHALMKRCIEILKLERLSKDVPAESLIAACTDEEYARLQDR